MAVVFFLGLLLLVFTFIYFVFGGSSCVKRCTARLWIISGSTSSSKKKWMDDFESHNWVSWSWKPFQLKWFCVSESVSKDIFAGKHIHFIVQYGWKVESFRFYKRAVLSFIRGNWKIQEYFFWFLWWIFEHHY